jgi:hypothetical protein
MDRDKSEANITSEIVRDYKPIWQPFVDESLKIVKKLDTLTKTAQPIAALLVAGAVTGLYLIYRTSRETRRATQAEILSQLLSQYDSGPMPYAMRGLFQWRRDHPTDFVEQFVALYLKGDSKGKEVDDHRRYAFRYFYKIMHFCKTGLIDADLIDEPFFRNPVAVDLVLNILQPLQKAHSDEVSKTRYPNEVFDYYRKRFHPRTNDT